MVKLQSRFNGVINGRHVVVDEVFETVGSPEVDDNVRVGNVWPLIDNVFTDLSKTTWSTSSRCCGG